MVPSMGTMERLYSPKINNVAVVFNFNTIFYVRSRSEEISPPQPCSNLLNICARLNLILGNDGCVDLTQAFLFSYLSEW